MGAQPVPAHRRVRRRPVVWSNAAKQSKWVRKEVLYALDRKHGDECAPPEVGPVIIEGPPIPRPWKELAHLHFNDLRIYLMDR